MKKPKYIELFYSLSEKEIKEFGKFINSLFFNESQRLVLMFDYLKKATANKPVTLSIQEAESLLFPNHKPSDDDIRKLFSDFSLIIEEFLTIKSLRKYVFQKNFFLLKELRKRHLDSIFESKIKEQRILLSDFKTRSREYYLDRVKFLNEEYLYLHSRHKTEKALKTSAETDRVTELMYLTLKLNVFINDRFEGVKKKKESNSLMNINDVFKFIGTRLNSVRKNEPRLFVYYLIAKLIHKREDFKSVVYIRKYISMNKELINPDTVDYFLNVLFRICVTKMNDGKNTFSPVAYEILKEMENDGVFDRMREIPDITFFSMITFSLFLKETAKAEFFIKKYGGKLNPSVREETYGVCMALISFANRKYTDVIKYTINIKTKNLDYYLNIKSVLLKTYYETGNFKYIHSMTDSIEHYIRRKKEMNGTMKRSISGFLKYVLKLTKAKKDSGKNIHILAETFESEGNFFQNDWVKQKIEELEEKSNFVQQLSDPNGRKILY